jgi:carboxyl-terminal processing protease
MAFFAFFCNKKERMNRNKFQVFLPLILAGVLVIGILLGMKLGLNGHGLPLFGIQKEDKLRNVINYVQENYVDTVSKQALEAKAITGLLENLDPHSVYISASEFHDANDPLMGNFEGIGVQFRLERDTITVINTVAGGPSEKLGIKAGDRIVKIDGKKVTGIKISNSEVMKRLKGKKGTIVEVSVFRRGVNGLINYSIHRDVIPTYSLDISYMVEPGIGYIRLNNFSVTTNEEVAAALEELKAKGMKKLILDLRGNGGGSLLAAIDVADEFIPKGKLIVYTKGANHAKEVAYATGNGLFETGELIIMIDEGSASASEIVAGAVQDNDRGTILGRRSFGKGLVQEQMNLKDGSAIRLTVARYYTPTGRCIQRSYKNGTEDYINEYYHRFLNGEVDNADSIHFADSLKFRTPKGKIVYGGGGIMPDVFVPIERDSTLKYYNRVVNKGTVFQFAFDYTDKYRKSLVFRNFDQYNKNFRVTDDVFSEFIRYAEKDGIKHEGKELAKADAKIRLLIKAYIGRNLLDNPGFYPILNSDDPAFLKAVSTIRNGTS